MKASGTFTIQCSQCDRFENYRFTALWQGLLERKIAEAIEYFKACGWVELPSGNWICPRRSHNDEQNQQEVAA